MIWLKKWRLQRLLIDRAKAEEKYEEAKRALREGTVCVILGQEQVTRRQERLIEIKTKILNLEGDLRYI